MKPKYPDIKVRLTGEDGNVFLVIGNVGMALLRAGVSAAECKAFREEAIKGDYDHVLQTAMKWVNIT